MTCLARRLLALALLTGALAVVAPALAPPPASAAARISVVNDRGTSAADLQYRTRLTISGRGFQVVKGGFGGVYVMFGWVDDPRGGSWKPSRGGVTGTDYRYIPDAEDAATNQGYLRFIAFPGSSTASEANAVLSASGGFTVSLTVPGPTFQSVDRNGKVVSVDCRTVTCGVITIGAHGVKNPANESFTPVRFTTVYDAAPAGGEESTSADSPATSGSGPGTSAATTPGTATPRKARTAAPKVLTDRLTAKVGNTLAFTGTGFRPGEQVVGVLDDGVAGIGPMVAGPSGEVAGILPLPATLSPGTHELRLTGAASGSAASERFAVRAADDADDDTAAATEPAAATADDGDGPSASRLFLLAAATLLALAAIGLLARVLLRRRTAVRAA